MFLALSVMFALNSPAAGARTIGPEVFRCLSGTTPPGALQVAGVPLGGREATLVVERFEVFTPDVWVDVHTPAGRIRGERPLTRYYLGQLLGEPDSLVFLSIDDDVRGLVQSGNRTFSIEPSSSLRHGTGKGLLVTEVGSPPQDFEVLRCSSVELANARRPEGSREAPLLAAGTVYDIRVAIETDYELFQLDGSVAAATAHIGRVLGAASAIYYRDVSARLLVGYLSIWATSEDPWAAATGNASDALSQLADYWHTNRSNVARNLVHFMSGTITRGAAAPIGSLCSPDIPIGTTGHWFGAYGVGGGVSGWFGDVSGVSHEIGHQLGSPHTHCYIPPVDQCSASEAAGGCYAGPTSEPPEGGTIMSYCASRLVLGRPDEPSRAVTERIRAFIESKAECLTVAAACSLSISPTSTNIGADDGVRFITVTASNPTCTWEVRTDSSFVHVTTDPLGAGATSVRLLIDSNPGAARSATVLVNDQPFTINQLAGCTTSGTTLCLNYRRRFKVTVDWTNPYDGGSTGIGTASQLTTDTGTFWFFSPSNVELAVKILDGRGYNGKFWVFYGALTDVGYTITITDSYTGAVKTYNNPERHLGSVADTNAFDGP